MSPLDLAESLAGSSDPESRATAVAIVTRGLTDDSPSDPFRQGWPMTHQTVRAAAMYLGLDNSNEALVSRALELAPTLSDAMLNKRSV